MTKHGATFCEYEGNMILSRARERKTDCASSDVTEIENKNHKSILQINKIEYLLCEICRSKVKNVLEVTFTAMKIASKFWC